MLISPTDLETNKVCRKVAMFKQKKCVVVLFKNIYIKFSFSVPFAFRTLQHLSVSKSMSLTRCNFHFLQK